MKKFLVISDKEFLGFTIEAPNEAEARIELDMLRETRFEEITDEENTEEPECRS